MPRIIALQLKNPSENPSKYETVKNHVQKPKSYDRENQQPNSKKKNATKGKQILKYNPLSIREIDKNREDRFVHPRRLVAIRNDSSTIAL